MADPGPRRRSRRLVRRNLAAVLVDLERLYPGIRFRMIDEQNRIRAHIRFFVNGAQARDLAQPLRPTDELVIVQALSGG
ncbi:MAG: MoaD/ThiS family protein [Betaproteobacteria bacterium]|nr:MoaD/ThiS family protein [Betaproteobacteria bacterium]